MKETIVYDGFKWYLNSGYYRNNLHGALHRYIWEKHNGCKIPEGYIIHHKDHDKLNNDPNNLILMTESEHNSHHMIGEKNPMYGTKKTDEQKKSLSEKVSLAKCKYKIWFVEEDIQFDNILECSAYMKRKYGWTAPKKSLEEGIRKVCRRHRETYKGFTFRYIEL